MKTKITLSDGTIHKGYFSLLTYDLSLERDDGGYFYSASTGKMRLRSAVKDQNHFLDIVETDYHFTNTVRRMLADTFQLYDSIVVVFGKEAAGASFGVINSPRKIAKYAIQDIFIDRIYLFLPGQGIRSELNLEDLPWLQNKTARNVVNLGGGGLCSYRAFLFEANEEKVKDIFDKLRKLYSKEEQINNVGEFQRLQLQIRKALEVLKKERIIVISSCSC